MKKALLLILLLGPLPVLAQEDITNRLTLSARFGFNISARFKGVSSLPMPASTRTTPRGDAYNFDDGYVLPDISGSLDGQTWYWGYDDSTRQVNGQNNTILMSRSTLANSAGEATADNEPSFGAELVYQRLLTKTGNFRLGLEFAANYLNLSLHDDRTLPGDLARTTYPFGFTPGTTPPSTSAGPYQGSFDGPGFVINASYDSPTTSIVPGGAAIAGHRQFDADLYGFRAGPFIELPLGSRFNVALSAGLAGGWLDADASWTEMAIANGASGAPVSGSGHGDSFLWGFYAEANVSWQFSKRWSAVVGAQYENLGDYSHSFGGRDVEAKLNNSVFFTAGLTWNF